MKTAAVGSPATFCDSLFWGFPIHFRVEQEHWLARTHASRTPISGRSLASMLLECKVRKWNNQWFWSLPDQWEARCANVTDPQNGVLVCESAGNRPERGLDLMGKDPGGEVAVIKEKALVS